MESIFSQNYKPVEIIVLDDGSTDDTPELMASYGNRIRYYRQKNQGAASARTAACRLARGEYIAFQDDDDLMPPDRIVRLYNVLQQYPSAVLAIGDWETIDKNGKPTGQRSRFKIHSENGKPALMRDGYKAVLWPHITPVPHASLFRKVDGERIGWFDTRFFNAVEDTDFFARLGQLGPIVYLPKIVSYYRKGHNQMMSKKFLLVCNQFLLFEKHLSLLKPEHDTLRRRLQSRLLSSLKQIAFYQGQVLKLPDSMPTDYLNRGLALLSKKDCLSYKWYKHIRLPLRMLVKGHHRICTNSH